MDHRGVGEGSSPDRERVLLPPSAESIWADLHLQKERSQKIRSDAEALDIEARFLVRQSFSKAATHRYSCTDTVS